MNAVLEQRLRRFKARHAVRLWEYRQRNYAKGMWYRVRLTLARAEQAFVIPLEEGRRLIAEGLGPESVGDEMQPPRLIVFVPRERVLSIPGAREVAVRLSAELLSADCLALVRFQR